MKVLRYEAHSVLGVKDIRFDLEGQHLFLVGGKNAQGKTSALTALLLALCGKKDFDWPDVTLREGESEGWVKVQLSGDDELHEPQGLTVELKLKRKRNGQVVEEFRVLDSAGDEAPEPRTLLKRLCELRGFDPLSFERLDKKGKKALLEKLLGLDFSAERAEYKRLYDQRTSVNRDAGDAKAFHDALPHFPDAPTEEVSTGKLMAELDRRQALNRANKVERERLTTLNSQIAASQAKSKSIEEQIAKLQKELDGLYQEQDTLAKDRAAQEVVVLNLQDADEKEIREQIAGAGEVNRQVQANQKKGEARIRLDALELKAEALSQKLEAIDAGVKERMQGAPWPVPGLAFDAEGVTLDGLPFEQASRRQRIHASVKIGMALHPKLKLFVCQHGGDLDGESLTELETLLRENDYQMVLELATRSREDEARCAVVIQDGKISQAAG